MRLLVCGGRGFRDKEKAFAGLDGVVSGYGSKPEIVIHGGASGADYLGGRWAQERDVPVQEYRADWNQHGRAAGPLRNQRMLEDGKPTLVVAFKGGRGTADMVRRAKAAGIAVLDLA